MSSFYLYGNPQDLTPKMINHNKQKKAVIFCMRVVCHTLTKHAHLSLCKRVLSPA